MSLSTQYTAAVCFGNLKLQSALVSGLRAIIIPLSEKNDFYMSQFADSYTTIIALKTKVKSKQHYFEQK